MSAIDANLKDNPYVGPRAFGPDDRNRFFGREREARDLIPLVIAERLVLFYAQSGAGKSSLINTKLIPGLVERNFQVLPVGRVSGQTEKEIAVDNVFVYNLLLSLDRQSGRDPERLLTMSLPDYLANLDVTVPAGGNGGGQAVTQEPQAHLFLDAPQVISGVRPLALLIDQFEEIFNTHPEAWKQREPFFEQLCEAMEADPYLWVILVMREDYIAGLDPYLYLLPGRLRARYSMKRMEYDAALEAVTRPAATWGRPFEPGVAEELVDNLRSVVSGQDENGKPVYQDGEFVEPVQLQVVCYQLWEQLKDTPGSSITREDLNKLTRGKSLAEFISRALADFYNQAVEYVVKNEPGVNERAIREMFAEKLITEAGTRGLVFRGDDTTEGLPNEVFRLLEQQFIIRTEKRGGSTWYEIVHDRFVDPIIQANREWNEKNPRRFQREAELWIKSGRDRSKLYEGKQLADAIQVKTDHRDELSPEELEFIQASESAAEAARARRQRQLMGVIVGIAAVLIALTIFSLVGWRSANTNKVLADEQKGTAVSAASTSDAYSKLAEERAIVAQTAQANEAVQRRAAETAQAQEAGLKKNALDAKAEADLQRNVAQTAEAYAEVQKNMAQTSEAKAVVANTQSQASRLAILSDYFKDKKLDLSLLLAVEGVNLSDNWSTRQSLLNSLQQGLNLQLDKDGAGLFSTDQVKSLAYNPDGDRIAVGYTTGEVRVIRSDTHLNALTIPDNFKSQQAINSLSFNSDRDFLASGGNDGTVRLMNLSTSEVTQYQPFSSKYVFPSIRAVAFQPNGSLLAVATDAVQFETEKAKSGHVVLYDYRKKSQVADFEVNPSDCLVLAWSQDGSKLAVGTKDGSIFGFDPVQKLMIFPLQRVHQDAVTGLAWYPDDIRLVSGSLDKQLIQWDTSAQKQLIAASYQDVPVLRSLDISTNGRFIITGSSDNGLRVLVWDAETLKRKDYPILIGAHVLSVETVKFSPRGDQFISGSFDGYVMFWKFNPVDSLQRPVLTLNSNQQNKGRLDGIYKDNQGNLLAAQLKAAKQLRLWTNGSPTPTVNELALDYAKLGFGSYQGQPVILAGGWDGKVNLVDLTGKSLLTIPVGNGTINSVAISADGKTLAAVYCLAVNNCDNLVLWDLEKNQKIDLKSDIKKLKLGSIPSLAFNPDASMLAMGTNNSRVFLYHMDDGGTSQVVTEGLNLSNAILEVTSITFSPSDVGLLAAGFHDGRIALWSSTTLYPVGVYADRMSADITGMFFQQVKGPTDPQPFWALTASSSLGEVWNWQVDLEQWNARACKLASRTLTQDEKDKFLPSDHINDNPCADDVKK